TQWIGNITIRVFFYHDFDDSHWVSYVFRKLDKGNSDRFLILFLRLWRITRLTSRSLIDRWNAG
ncbi:MAG TPA: hypothetical protein V6C88_06970, partial [Chroococcidiopsis sp.]